MTTGPYHRLLTRQLSRCRRADGEVDVDALLALVHATYEEDDRDRARVEHANRLMCEEIEAAQAELRASVAELRVQNARFDAALQHMGRGLCMFDGQRRLVVHNRRFVELFGLEGMALVGRRWDEMAALCVSHTGDVQAIEHELQTLRQLCGADGHQAVQMERADGRIMMVVHEPVPDAGGFVHTFTDVTDRRRVDAEMARMASHDALTQLPNRMLLQQRLELALVHRPEGRQCALMYVDLDRFKAVNDTLGHPAGDLLLVQVTERLRRVVRGSDTVARLGGDEFAILLEGLPEGFRLGDLAQRIVHSLEQPFDLEGHTANIGASIGIALAPRDGHDPVVLTKRADMALYEAKSAGRGRYCFFESGMDDAARARREIELELRGALERGEFTLHYQPVMDLARQRVSGCEALLRWQSPGRGLVLPDRFIPLAEELGLIVPIGGWVLQRACADAMTWPAHLRVAVNVSVRQLAQGEVLALAVQQALAESGLAADRLELEITESVLMTESEATLATLQALKALGVRIVMDDFGIGYSSLAYLRSFPFDKVKIDRSFVREIGQRADALAIVRAVSSLCGSLGIASTAEGVETAEQLDHVTDHACTEAQGYLFSRPVPQSELPALLAALASTPASAAAADGSSAPILA